MEQWLVQHVIHLAQAGDQGCDFHPVKDLCGILDRSKSAGVVGNDAQQLGRYAMGGQHIVTADALHRQEFILGGDFGDGDQLQPIFFTAGSIEEQVAEIARPLAVAQSIAQRIDVSLVLKRIGGIEDIAGVAAVFVITATEQGRRLVQQRTLNRRQIARHAIDVLVDVGFGQMQHLIYANWDGIVAWFTAKLEAVTTAFDQGFLQGLCALFLEFNPFLILLEAANGLVNYLFSIDIKGWLLEQINGLSDAMPDWFKDMVGLETPTPPPLPAVTTTAAAMGTGLRDTQADLALVAGHRDTGPRLEDNSNHTTTITVMAQPGQDPQAVGQAVYDRFNGATAKSTSGGLLFDPA